MTQIFRHVANPSDALRAHFGGVDHFNEGASIPRNAEFTEEIVAKRAGYCVVKDEESYCGFDSIEDARAFDPESGRFVDEVETSDPGTLLIPTGEATPAIATVEEVTSEAVALGILEESLDASDYSAARIEDDTLVLTVPADVTPSTEDPAADSEETE